MMPQTLGQKPWSLKRLSDDTKNSSRLVKQHSVPSSHGDSRTKTPVWRTMLQQAELKYMSWVQIHNLPVFYSHLCSLKSTYVIYLEIYYTFIYPPVEDVFPIENGDCPASHVGLLEGITVQLLGVFDGPPVVWGAVTTWRWFQGFRRIHGSLTESLKTIWVLNQK